MDKYGKFTFSKKFLDSAKWRDFKKLCIDNPRIGAKDEYEAYELWKFEKGTEVASMERKLKDK